MKIYSVCKFVGIDEDDILLRIKIENEKDLVDEWILIMNKRRWNGDVINNASFEKIISKKFYEPYKNRIICIKIEVSPWDKTFPIWDEGLSKFCNPQDQKSNYEYYRALCREKDTSENRKHLERFMLSTARHHSSFAYDYLMKKAKAKDIILISDLDESIDTTIKYKKEMIQTFLSRISKLEVGGRILRHKFQYDYINSWPEESYRPLQEKGTRWIHSVSWKLIKEYGRYAFQDFRALDMRNNLVSNEASLAFEYTLCCGLTELKNKFKYNGHANGTSELDIITALKLNRSCIDTSKLSYSEILAKLNTSMNFEFIKNLDERRSSKYILDNLTALRTYNVPANYDSYRKRLSELV